MHESLSFSILCFITDLRIRLCVLIVFRSLFFVKLKLITCIEENIIFLLHLDDDQCESNSSNRIGTIHGYGSNYYFTDNNICYWCFITFKAKRSNEITSSALQYRPIRFSEHFDHINNIGYPETVTSFNARIVCARKDKQPIDFIL